MSVREDQTKKRMMSERKGELPERKENSKSFRDEKQEARRKKGRRSARQEKEKDTDLEDRTFIISKGGRRGSGGSDL